MSSDDQHQNDHDIRTLANLAVDWKRERIQSEQLILSINNAIDHLSKGQDRIFRVLESMETKIGGHGERLTRTEERTNDATQKISMHIDEHWKQSALNISLVGMIMAIWKLLNKTIP